MDITHSISSKSNNDAQVAVKGTLTPWTAACGCPVHMETALAPALFRCVVLLAAPGLCRRHRALYRKPEAALYVHLTIIAGNRTAVKYCSAAVK